MKSEQSFTSIGRMQAMLLRAIKTDLDLVLAPELSSEEARLTATLASEMLSHLIVAQAELPALAESFVPRMQALLQQANALPAKLSRQGQPDAPQPRVASELYAGGRFSEVTAELATRVAELITVDKESDPALSGDEISNLLRDAVSVEQDYLVKQFALVEQQMANRADPVVAVETKITAHSLQAFIDARQLQQSAGNVERVQRIPGGYSKDTWLLHISGQLEGHQELILRRDLPFGPGENSVIDEYALVKYLATEGLAVPPPIWLEESAAFVGKPFILFPKLEGSAVFGEWEAAEEEQHAVIHAVVKLMARLHTLDPFASDVVDKQLARRSPAAAVRDYITDWRDKWIRRRVHPSVIMETAFDWLLSNIPATLPRLSFIHGDISFRNTLIVDGQLNALLDWEFWHLGDPIEDLSYFRLVAEPYIQWEEVMQIYQQAGGGDYDEERAKFYAVWRSVRNGTTTTTAWHGFLSGEYPASKAAYQGVSLYRLFLRDVAAQLELVSK